MSDSKILFSDLDGTLLNDQKEIEQPTKDTIKEMLAQGHYFAFCTGRPLSSAKNIAAKYNLDEKGCYIVSYNGGVLYDLAEGRILSYASIPLDLVRELFHKAQEAGMYIHTYDQEDTVLTKAMTPELEFYWSRTGQPYKTGITPEDITQAPPKAVLINLEDTGKLQWFQEANAKWARGKMNSFFSCLELLEYCPQGVSKGDGVRALCEYLKLPIEASIAAGDERNDISMLEAASIAAVPSNAYHEVRTMADYICETDNNHDAVGEIIKKFILS